LGTTLGKREMGSMSPKVNEPPLTGWGPNLGWGGKNNRVDPVSERVRGNIRFSKGKFKLTRHAEKTRSRMGGAVGALTPVPDFKKPKGAGERSGWGKRGRANLGFGPGSSRAPVPGGTGNEWDSFAFRQRSLSGNIKSIRPSVCPQEKRVIQ